MTTGLLPTRAVAADAVTRVIDSRVRLDVALQEARHLLAEPGDAAFLQESVYGVLRHFFTLSAQLDRYLTRPLKARDFALRALLLCGLHELRYLATPPHATVHQTVAACEALDRRWAKGLVNAVLRRASREVAAEPAGEGPDEIRFEHPAWLIEKIRSDWPGEWQEILRANVARAPLTLRVNSRLTSRIAYLARLQAAGCAAQAVVHADCGVALEKPRSVAEIPGFSEGHVSVQDEAAQLAAILLDCRPTDRVLDACCAPGGKTAHLLERTPGIRLLAADLSERRIAETKSTLARLGVDCRLLARDAREIGNDDLFDGQLFSRILLDAPCTATGVIRRHPDIRLRRLPEDVDRAVVQQGELLRATWSLLEDNGTLLYATCSILRAENDGVIGSFLAETPDAVALGIVAPWGIASQHGRQILPGQSAMDGFYYALLTKRPQTVS
ncbi:MAG: 16S rRNA (cytosine(967)-C(5))-methyltransferase RsmB [Gammaproteobacteria bacterium]